MLEIIPERKTEFQEAIRWGRINKRMTVRNAAAQFGVKPGELSQMEHHMDVSISSVLLVKMCRLYGIHYFELREMFSNGCDE